MLNIKTPKGIFRRYLLWLKYDGSRFPEMATSSHGFGIVDTVHRCLEYLTNPSTLQPNNIRISPSSRTDSGVHAHRTSVIVHMPLKDNEALDETPKMKEKNLSKINELLRSANSEALKVLDFHSVSPGFCARRHVIYRHYAYRLVVPKSFDLCYPNKPSLPLISENPYSFILTPRFDVNRAAEACQKLEGVHNIASFFKHTFRERREGSTENTIRWLRHIGITRGSAYSLSSSHFDYYVVNFISRSYCREQIRRMIAVIVAYANGRIEMRDIEWLLSRPDPINFFAFHIKAAPPNGLFLANVVYDPDSYLNPQPYAIHPWDYDDPLLEVNDEKNNVC
uniref:tRNA pseudouridine synthase n=1 Tax=Panagrolaimus sp. ES5 TaxID=591445 RepID=A0AC34GUM3_9BILA